MDGCCLNDVTWLDNQNEQGYRLAFRLDHCKEKYLNFGLGQSLLVVHVIVDWSDAEGWENLGNAFTRAMQGALDAKSSRQSCITKQ